MDLFVQCTLRGRLQLTRIDSGDTKTNRSCVARYMNPIKALVRFIPGGKRLAERLSYRRRSRLLQQIGDAEARFTHIYERNKWKNEESRSGPGSTVEYTRNIRREIPRLIDRYNIASMLDAPCGDYNWFRLIERPKEVHYIGGEIVKELVASNTRQFADDTTKFIHLDITTDPLPDVDLWMCRDCLFHLSTDDIRRAINNFLDSNVRYLLTSIHPEHEENIDIPTGHFRLLNLERPPFNFCEAIQYIDDWIEGRPVKRLALWERQALHRHLSNPAG